MESKPLILKPQKLLSSSMKIPIRPSCISKGHIVSSRCYSDRVITSEVIRKTLEEQHGLDCTVETISGSLSDEIDDLYDEDGIGPYSSIEPYLGSNVYRLRGFDENGDPYDPFSYDHHESKK